MIFIRFCLFTFLLFSAVLCNAQNEIKLTSAEQAYLEVFNDFLSYIKKGNSQNAGSISKSSHKNLKTINGKEFANSAKKTDQKDNINFLLSNYILAASYSADSTSKIQELNKIRSEINDLYSFFGNMNIDNIKSLPLRLYEDKYVYTKLSPYQQNNTLVFFDKTLPEKILGYILFVPGNQIKSNGPKILSWKLVFSYGTFFFEDILGQKGPEAFFEGVKKSSNPVSL